MPTNDGIVFIIAVVLLFIISAGSVFISNKNDIDENKETKTMIELNDVISDIKVEKIIDKKYEEMTVPELKEMAKIYNISGYSSMKKSELLDILKNTHPQ